VDKLLTAWSEYVNADYGATLGDFTNRACAIAREAHEARLAAHHPQHVLRRQGEAGPPEGEEQET